MSFITGVAGITADSVSVLIRQGAWNAPGDEETPLRVSGPNQNTWGEQYVLKGAKVGHTYRHGPVVIRVLGTWQSSKSADDKRGYLHVSFDESEIVCPPLPAETVEVAGQ
ncbi:MULTISPECIES: hypothetical protein [unclassified Leifsonia]|uniref:hypothetical protein n=1 Tax=unclassified Leifsonia TaxID=2663824 RepID=UPI0008A790A7|nr:MULTISPECIES: hypothetical protein [unclassified Leifsonia]SEH96755.1 hypothetical protein SAMN04515694_10831 [Leifsonia sp. CL154]SFL64032.1 hypothetical protein SAMN04515692_108105 [Leifsonia sp. CL147]